MVAIAETAGTATSEAGVFLVALGIAGKARAAEALLGQLLFATVATELVKRTRRVRTSLAGTLAAAPGGAEPAVQGRAFTAARSRTAWTNCSKR